MPGTAPRARACRAGRFCQRGAAEGAVLAHHADARVAGHSHQEASLTLVEAEARHTRNAILERHDNISSASRDSRARPERDAPEAPDNLAPMAE